MRTVRYNREALKALKRYGNMSMRLLRVVREYADDPDQHANNVTALKGSSGYRRRVGDFRILSNETKDEIGVTDIGPRGGI